jgi:hypothetical protein
MRHGAAAALVAALVGALTCVAAAAERPRSVRAWRRWTAVHALAQTTDGFLWIAPRGGVTGQARGGGDLTDVLGALDAWCRAA